MKSFCDSSLSLSVYSGPAVHLPQRDGIRFCGFYNRKRCIWAKRKNMDYRMVNKTVTFLKNVVGDFQQKNE